MRTNDDPLARRALFVAFEEKGCKTYRSAHGLLVGVHVHETPGPARLRPAYGQPRQFRACAQLN
jgi:hypothetical protein